MRRGRIAATAVVLVACAAAPLGGGCSSDQKDLFVTRYDAGLDAPAAQGDAEPEVDPTIGGPCTEDAQCDDAIPCTYDRCDQTIARCRNTPDDTQCDNGTYCDGKEKCVPRKGCTPGPVVTCQDDDACTIDRCVEATKSCEHKPRDVDGDGDPDDHCVVHRDCDDTDPTVSSQLTEICDNGKDDNCNGVVDETNGCQVAQNDDCSKPFVVAASGTFLLSTVAAKKDYTPSCSVSAPQASRDIVLAITAPMGGDVEVWATAQDPANEVAVELERTCGQSANKLACAHLPQGSTARAIARSVDVTTVYAVVTTQKEGAVDVHVDLRTPGTTAPTNEDCSAPSDVTIDAPFTVSLVDAAKNLPSDCTSATATGELTYRFTIPGNQPQDVRIFASTVAGHGDPLVSLRSDADCAGTELRCRQGAVPALFARGLAPGPHVFSVAATAPLDASVLVKTYPATTPPANQYCATAPAAATNTSFLVDLSNQEDAIRNKCLPGGLAAAYDLPLAQASDVLVVGRFPPFESGAVALQGPEAANPVCTADDRLLCAVSTSPARVTKRNLAAGDYKVVIADQTGQQNAQLNVLVRPTVAPTAVTGADNCSQPGTIPASGGFFTGDTTGATADFDTGCDTPGTPVGGAKDQIFRLDLAQRSRVVLDMTGSSYTTILDIRQGATCPGTEVQNACYVGFNVGRSFLDVTLDPGTYWVQVDGYSGDAGPWNLDVRVLTP